MRIRPGSAHHWRSIARVHEEAATVAYAGIFCAEPFPREETLERWRTFEGQIVVAEEGAQIIGFIAFDASELHALYVLPEYQGRGVGSRLLEAAGSAMRLWVLKKNLAGRRFYERHGWRAEGTEQLSFGAIELLYCRNKRP